MLHRQQIALLREWRAAARAGRRRRRGGAASAAAADRQRHRQRTRRHRIVFDVAADKERRLDRYFVTQGARCPSRSRRRATSSATGRDLNGPTRTRYSSTRSTIFAVRYAGFRPP